jgi:hypothetical protein
VQDIFVKDVDTMKEPKMQSRQTCWFLAYMLEELLQGLQEYGNKLHPFMNFNVAEQRINEVIQDDKNHL